MNNKNAKNNSVMKAAEYRGWSKAKIEGIEITITGHGKCLRAIQSDIVLIKEFMAANNAVRKLKSGLWGLLGGLLPAVIYVILRFTNII